MQGNSLGDKNGLSILRRHYFSLILGLDQTNSAEKKDDSCCARLLDKDKEIEGRV